MGNSVTFQQTDLFNPTYLAECPGCGQQFDVRPRQGVYRGGRHRKYCSDKCRKTTKRRDERLQAAITAMAGDKPQASRPVESQKIAQEEAAAEVSNHHHHSTQTQIGQVGQRQRQGWWYLIEDHPGGVGQVGPLVETQAHRLLERLRSDAVTTPNQNVSAIPAIYHAPSLAVALEMHYKRTRPGLAHIQ